MAIDPLDHQYQQHQDHPRDQAGPPRSYFVPSNLPSRPTDEEIAALEKYFGSHITTSSQSRPISTARAPERYLSSGTGNHPDIDQAELQQGVGGLHQQQQQPQYQPLPLNQIQAQSGAQPPNLPAQPEQNRKSFFGLDWGIHKPFGFPPVFSNPFGHGPNRDQGQGQGQGQGQVPIHQLDQHQHQGQVLPNQPDQDQDYFLPDPYILPQPQQEEGQIANPQFERQQGQAGAAGRQDPASGLLHPDSARLPSYPYGQSHTHNQEPPSPLSPTSKFARDDTTSLAPSQSLSQLAVRRAKRSKEKVERRGSTGSALPRRRSSVAGTGGKEEKKARRLTGYYQKPDTYNHDHDHDHDQENDKDLDLGGMNVDDWARSQGGQSHSQGRARSHRALSPGEEEGYSPPHRRRTGGTNVDVGGDESEVARSERSTNFGYGGNSGGREGEADRATLRSRAGTGWSQVYPESQLPGRRTAPSQSQHHAHDDRRSYAPTARESVLGEGGWRSPEISEGVPESEVASMMDRMTIGARSGMTGQTGLTGMVGLPYRNMERMREALDDERREQRRLEASRARESDSREHSLHRSKSQLKSLQNTVRDLQARIIAEQVTRSETEREAVARAEEVRTYRDELAGAVRALRRAKEESRELDEERRKGLRLFEETRERLVKLREAYKVQEAREAGRDEGRLEAFQEIERWMGNPPIPIEPMGYLPSGVLHPNERQNQQADEQQGGQVRQDKQRQPQQQQSPEQGQQPRPQYQSFGDSADRLNQQAQRVASQAQGNRRPSTSPYPGSNREPTPRDPPAMPPHSMAGANAASSYLDRVEHDSRMQNMLHGAPQRTFTMPSPAPTGHTRSRAPDTLAPPDSASLLDKPLPSPHGRSSHQGHHQQPSRAGHSRQGSQIPRDILSPPRQDHNAPFDRSLSQADRYPPFPTHRTESILDHAVPLWPNPDMRGAQSVDPRGMPLPDSRETSEYHHHGQAASRGPVPPSHATHRSNKTARSRLAAGLRGDDDPLSMIEETDEQVMDRQSPNPHRVPLPPSTAGGTHYHPARSMQSFMSSKFKPKQPVMPNPLGMSATATTNDNNLRGMYDADRAARHTATLPDATNQYHPEDSHPMSLSPEQNNMEPINQHYREPSGGGSRGGMLGVSRAPTIHVMPPSRDSPERDAPQSTFDKGSVLPANIPLPETRPGTMYGTEVNHPQHHHQRHSINAIDFAQRHPLPESRPTTIMERQSNGPLAAKVEDVADVDAPPVRRGVPLASILKRDPMLLPLPHSKAPTRRKTSSR